MTDIITLFFKFMQNACVLFYFLTTWTHTKTHTSTIASFCTKLEDYGLRDKNLKCYGLHFVNFRYDLQYYPYITLLHSSYTVIHLYPGSHLT